MHTYRRWSAFLCAVLFALAPALSHAAGRYAASTAGSDKGTYVLGGSLRSSVTLTMTGSFSVPNIEDLTWRLPLAPSETLNGYKQVVTNTTFAFNTPPQSTSDGLDAAGHPVRQFTWHEPAGSGISVTETLRATITSSLKPFTSTAPYPLRSAPSSVKTYRAQTSLTRITGKARSQVRSLLRGKTAEANAVRAIATWIATHITFHNGQSVESAGSVFASRSGDGAGFANLMTGMLRAAKIPARVEIGWVGSQPFTVQGVRGAHATIHFGSTGDSGSLSAWVDAYFPHLGWVPFDPQIEQFFVDPRHVAFLIAADDSGFAGGDWSATTNAGSATATATGTATPGDAVEIVPGLSDGSTVQMSSKDSFRATILLYMKNVKKTVILTR